jgi:2-keto-4-pentenoate hydratase/2-oxohepta-3-ene-1,7-dioic acid hydratase in catechol pathway
MTQFSIATIAVSGESRLAVIRRDRVIELAEHLPGVPGSFRGLLDEWDAWCDRIGALLDEIGPNAGQEAGSVDFLAPILDPPTIYCVGANYADHTREMAPELAESRDGPPYFFLVPASALSGHRAPIVRPEEVEQLDWEVELAAIIGRAASHVPAADALDYVAGYTVANDVSVRDPRLVRDELVGMRWLAAKGYETFLPMGPGVVPSRFVADPMRLDLRLDVDGEVRQTSNTSRMVTSIGEQIAYLSAITPLLPGDSC